MLLINTRVHGAPTGALGTGQSKIPPAQARVAVRALMRARLRRRSQRHLRRRRRVLPAGEPYDLLDEHR
jgi:hypothetical protein